VVHAGTEQAQAAFAAQRVVAGQQDGAVRSEAFDEQSGQGLTQAVQGPGVVREEAMVAGPMADADLAGGENTLGNKAVPARQRPAGDDQDKQAERRRGEDGAKVL
jgi:hypothetical protein